MMTLAPSGTIQAVCGTATALTYTIFGMELASSVETYKVLAQGQIATSVGVLYTASSVTAFIKTIQIANTTGSAVSGLILYVNGTAASNKITGSLTIPANGTMIVTDKDMELHDANGNLMSIAPSLATPALVLGTAPVDGVANSTIRSDATLLAFDATVPAVTTPRLLGTTGSAGVAVRRDHRHQSPGGIFHMPSQLISSGTTSLQIFTFSIPIGLLQAGTTIKVTHAGRYTAPNPATTATFTLKMGNVGEVTASNRLLTTGIGGSGIFFQYEYFITVQAAGVSAAIETSFNLKSATTTGIFTQLIAGPFLTATTIDTTTTQNLISSYQNGGASGAMTIDIGVVEILKT